MCMKVKLELGWDWELSGGAYSFLYKVIVLIVGFATVPTLNRILDETFLTGLRSLKWKWSQFQFSGLVVLSNSNYEDDGFHLTRLTFHSLNLKFYNGVREWEREREYKRKEKHNNNNNNTNDEVRHNKCNNNWEEDKMRKRSYLLFSSLLLSL